MRVFPIFLKSAPLLALKEREVRSKCFVPRELPVGPISCRPLHPKSALIFSGKQCARLLTIRVTKRSTKSSSAMISHPWQAKRLKRPSKRLNRISRRSISTRRSWALDLSPHNRKENRYGDLVVRCGAKGFPESPSFPSLLGHADRRQHRYVHRGGAAGIGDAAGLCDRVAYRDQVGADNRHRSLDWRKLGERHLRGLPADPFWYSRRLWLSGDRARRLPDGKARRGAPRTGRLFHGRRHGLFNRHV